MKKIIFLCFILALVIRIYSVFPYNTIIGFDQARDLFDSYTMVQTHHPRIIGPTAGNNPNLHHGIAFIYYLAVPIAFFGPNPMNAVYMNIFIQCTLVFILAYFSWELFHKKETTIVASLMVAFSYSLTQFAGWLSNPTVTLVTVPLFYLSLWKYRTNQKWLIVAALALGASIEFELFFIYLFPVFLVYWALYRPKLPSLVIFGASLLTFMATTATMIATEIKYSFAGVIDILSAGTKVGGNLPFWDRIHFFSLRLQDQFSLSLGPIVPTTVAILFCVYIYTQTTDKKTKEGLGFVYLYAASPTLMLFLGAHNAPWFLIGLPPAMILIYSFVLSRAKAAGYIILIIFLSVAFYKTSLTTRSGQKLLEPDQSAILSRQLAAIDYTYKSANGEPFAIDTVTNPLYVNAVWAYSYMWYGKSTYGYTPTWLGGDQIAPYNTLEKANSRETTVFLLEDITNRIPQVYRDRAHNTILENATFRERVTFDEIGVNRYEKK
ncbi:hypothetical protein KBA63_01235 [Candidatus Woesebacteria bacterium]|nr:hypothetical protein [Candidatus Woesebacteria bacterium]MBP9687200.1 hypothetical protein [Candidatus Woesebacteria bacterium]